MKMQDFMQKIKEKKLKRSDWLILVLAGILILIIALPTDTKEKKQAEEAKENISKENNTMEASKDEIERKLEDILEKIILAIIFKKKNDDATLKDKDH